MQSVAIIGIGRVGGALSIALAKKGFSVDKLFVRNGKDLDHVTKHFAPIPRILDSSEFNEIEEDIVFITTQDSEISDVAIELSRHLVKKPKFVFHTSGSRSSHILDPLLEMGICVGSIHPLVSISDPVQGIERFKDAFFCVEGDDDARKTAEKIVTEFGGNPFSIETKYKTLYHAAAVMSSGHFVALIDIATGILAKCGLNKENAREILIPLIESTIENIRQQSCEDALTGTFARADVETLVNHIDTLGRNVSSDEFAVYLQLGKRSLKLAESKGAAESDLREMNEILTKARKSS